jgi:hypothetical protein
LYSLDDVEQKVLCSSLKTVENKMYFLTHGHTDSETTTEKEFLHSKRLKASEKKLS